MMQSVGARGCIVAARVPGQASIEASFVLAQILRWVAAGAALCLFMDDLLRSFGVPVS